VAANKTVWSYDKVGNRLTEKVGAAAVSTYAYDVADQLASITGPGASSFGYNANGDLLTVTGSTSEVYTYNTARQTKTANGYSYSYDGNGNRWSVAKAGLSTSVEYWDTVGGLPVLVAEREQGNPGSFESAFFRRYTYAGSMPVRFETYETQGSPRQSRVASNLLTDQVGSVMVVTSDAQRDVRAAFRYSPFGASRTASWSTGFDSTPRFTGQKLDGSGSYHLRARQYTPGRGSFTQTDPMPYGAGSPFEGAYIYARNNPLLMNDPTGERATQAQASNVRVCFALDFACLLGHPGYPSLPQPVSLPRFPSVPTPSRNTLIRIGAKAVTVAVAIQTNQSILFNEKARGTKNVSGNNKVQNREFAEAIRRAERALGRRLRQDEIRRIRADYRAGHDFG
jgi:RHS repeat-associated protein